MHIVFSKPLFEKQEKCMMTTENFVFEYCHIGQVKAIEHVCYTYLKTKSLGQVFGSKKDGITR
jgi:hypothetical protein